MPQMSPINLEYPVNDDIERAQETMLAWGRRLGLDADPTTWKRFMGAESAKLICYSYPEAHGPDLDLAVDMMCLFVIVDEIFDGPLRGSPHQAASYVEHLLTALSPDPDPTRLTPISAAFADLWRKSIHGMSRQWQAMAYMNWAQYLWANVTEDVARTHLPPPSLDGFIEARRNSAGYRACRDMIERASGYEVSGLIRHQACFQELGDIPNDLITLTNDIFSLEKERDRGDTVSSVMLMADKLSLTDGEAVEKITERVKELLETFYNKANEVRAICVRLDLDEQQRTIVNRWIENNHAWIGANCDWSCEASRYTAGADPVDPNNDFLRELMYAGMPVMDHYPSTRDSA